MGGREKEDWESKSKLVTEICSMSSRSIACGVHGCHRHHRTRPPFIDWYHVLHVGEDAEIDVIRRQYRKLALQLHPDKNSHPKAEVAFKLVSEAYACLSNEAKRRAFDFERWNNSCTPCKRIMPCKTGNYSAEFHKTTDLQHLRQVRDRFREEARVIEKCLRTHGGASTKEGFPVFNPSNYSFKEYPHQRTQNSFKKPEDLQYLQASEVRKTGNRLKFDRLTGKYESLTFEIGSEMRSFRGQSAHLNSKCKVH